MSSYQLPWDYIEKINYVIDLGGNGEFHYNQQSSTIKILKKYRE